MIIWALCRPGMNLKAKERNITGAKRRQRFKEDNRNVENRKINQQHMTYKLYNIIQELPHTQNMYAKYIDI